MCRGCSLVFGLDQLAAMRADNLNISRVEYPFVGCTASRLTARMPLCCSVSDGPCGVVAGKDASL